jgi:hypothetical protein
MACGKKHVDIITIKLGHHKIAQVEEFFYLGSRITRDGRSEKDIVSRIDQMINVYHQMRSLLPPKNTSLEVRKHFIKT